jgi:hypothetical protein
VLPERSERDRQRHDPAPIVSDQVVQLAARRAIEPIRELTEDVPQHAGVARGRRRHRKGAHERRFVGAAQAPPRRCVRSGQEASERGAAPRRVRHELQGVGGVEGRDAAECPAPPEERAQAAIPEDPLEEVLAPVWVRQATLLLHREMGKGLQQGLGEQAARGRAAPADGHAQAAARRVLLEHVSAEIELAQRSHAPRRVAAQRGGAIAAALRGDQAHRPADPAQVHRLARHAEPGLDLGADGHPLDVTAEGLEQDGVALVPAVEPHRLAEQAGGDADAQRRGRRQAPHGSLTRGGRPAPRRRAAARSACRRRRAPPRRPTAPTRRTGTCAAPARWAAVGRCA